MICQGLSLYSILFYCPTGWDKHKSHSCSGSCRSWRITNHKMVWNLNLRWLGTYILHQIFGKELLYFKIYSGTGSVSIWHSYVDSLLIISSYWVQYCYLIGRAGFSEEVDKLWMAIRGSLTPTRTSQLSSKLSKITATYLQVVTSREIKRE